MSDYRSESEKFVTEFLDYVYKYDIQDEFNKRTQKMERSAGVTKLISHAESIFPARSKGGRQKIENIEEVIAEAKNVVDRRDVFARKIQQNGAARGLLEKLVRCPPEQTLEVLQLAEEFLQAEEGKKEFYVPTDSK